VSLTAYYIKECVALTLPRRELGSVSYVRPEVLEKILTRHAYTSNLIRFLWRHPERNSVAVSLGCQSGKASATNLLAKRVCTLDFDLMVLREIRHSRIRPRRSWARRVYIKTFSL
jgi:hypothetical protein